MSNYDAALEQYQEEMGGTKEQFDERVQAEGWDYVVYYCKRWHEAMAN